MLFILYQFKQWVYAHLNVSYKPKRVGPQTRCVVHRPVVGWDVGHEHIYHLFGAEQQVWEVSDMLVQDPAAIEVCVVKETIEQTSECPKWDESSDKSWAELMYYFAVAEGSWDM